MSKFELIYFPIHARGLSTRIMLQLGKADWVNTYPDWPMEKLNTPYGRLPVLVETKEDGSKFTLVESRAIEVYLANKFGLLPKDDSEKAKCLEYVSQTFDLIEGYCNVILFKVRTRNEFGSDHEGFHKKPEECTTKFDFYVAQNLVHLHKVLSNSTEFFLEKHEQILSKSKSVYYLGDSITYADISLYQAYADLKTIDHIHQFDSAKYPNVMKLIETLESNKDVVADVEKYDVNPYTYFNLPQ
ncbi:putative glutathione S-transferase 6 [Smittium culicis]|uniref:Putative glutathione S-transferase 6 n=1 Tax=Smittium culicis TaxID=133412 RepID=A0A1R1XNQ4_9FUNG|nr:putative glutathione S-transferase 6 [Smittium culicis]